MLEESRAAYETLRTEFYQIERKATALEAESEKLREDLELARESNRGLESTRIELSNDIAARHSQIGQLELQLAQESSERRSVSEARRALQEQYDAGEKRIGELEGELAAAREKLAWKTRSARCSWRSISRSMRPPASPAASPKPKTPSPRHARNSARSSRASRKPMPSAAASPPRWTSPRNSTRPSATI